MATVVEIALRAIDQASSAIEAVMGNATDAARTASDAYSKAGSEIDQASATAAEAIRNVGDTTQGAGQQMSDAMGTASNSAKGLGDVIKQWLSDPINQLGTGVTALGVGLGKLTSDTFDVSSAMDRAAIVTGMTNEQIRQLTYSNANAGLSAGEIAMSIEEIGRRGNFTAQEIESMVNAVDLMTDALGGEMAANLDSADRALSAFDIPLTQINEHLDTFTFLQKKTSVGVQEFGMYMSRVAPDIKAANLSMEDVAVALASIEASGIRGRPAITLLSQALTEAKGSGEQFWASLGIAQPIIDQQRASLEQTAGMTERLSAANEKNLGWYDALKAKLDIAKVAMGDYLQPLDDVGQAMTTLGPAILAANQAHEFFSSGIGKSVIPAVKSMGASLVSLATNPVALVIAAVIGLVALIVANWDWIKEKTALVWSEIKEHIITPVKGAWDWLVNAWGSISAFLGKTWQGIKDTAAGVWNGILSSIKSVINSIVGAINSMIRGLNRVHFSIPDWVPVLGGRSWGFNIREIPLLAAGGIATQPVLGMMGEAGDEAILPLDRIVPIVAEGVRAAGSATEVYIDMRGSTFQDGRDAANQIVRGLGRRGIRLGYGVAG
ncbi:MAG: hypothetical protein HPY55_06540 [Firmicutes bacterium]|nr:hypothetical protein [Bacillota bacterium]